MPRIHAAVSFRRLPILVFTLLLAVAAGIVFAATAERASNWRDRDIRIDGSDEDWQGELSPVPKEHFSLGIVNDGDYLYICLPTKDSGTKAQIAGAGLVVWLDPVGGKKRRFGVHFPVPNPPGQPGARRPARREGAYPEQPDSTRDPVPVRGQDVVGVLGPGKDDARLVPITEAAGIEGRVGVRGDLMVYELRVPLNRNSDHPYAPQAGPGQTVRFEIETAPLRGSWATGPYWVGGGPIPPRPWGPGAWGTTYGWGGRLDPIDAVMNVRLASGPR